MRLVAYMPNGALDLGCVAGCTAVRSRGAFGWDRCWSVGWPTERTSLCLQSDGEGMAAEAKPAEEPEPGEILAAAAPKPEELAPRDSLPKLEELIAATAGPSVDPVSEHAVLSGGVMLLPQTQRLHHSVGT